MMKSKIVLICVLLYCSKIVDSISQSENRVRQRANPLSNWQDNVPNAQYIDTDFTQTRGVNKLSNSGIQRENNDNYYSNQRGFNYDSYGYNKGPALSPSAEELLVNQDSPFDGRRLDSYPPRVESYPSHKSQVGFDHQQYRNQKWQSHNPFTNSASSLVLISNDETPLVTSGQESYRDPVQFLQSKFVPSSNHRFYQPGQSSPTREQFQYPPVDQAGNNQYGVKSASRFGSRGPVAYEGYSERQASEIKTRPTGSRRYAQNFETPSEINYETPAVVSSDSSRDKSQNIRYVENSRSLSHTDFSKTSPITKYDDSNSVINPDDEYNSDSILSDGSVPDENDRESQAAVSEIKNRSTIDRRYKQNLAPAVIAGSRNKINSILADKPLARRYAHRSESSGWSITARDDSNHGAPTDITETEVKEGNYETNYAEKMPIQDPPYPEESLSLTNTELENSETEETSIPQYGSSNPNDSIHHLTAGIKELSLNSLVANPEIQDILAQTSKRYVVVHANGSIEYLDTLPSESQQNSKLQLVRTDQKNVDGSEDDGVLTPQSPENLPTNIAQDDEYPFSMNQPAGEYDLSRPFKKLPARHSQLKRLPIQTKQPVDNEYSKPPPVSQPVDGGYSKSLIPNEDQTVDDYNSNSLAQLVNVPENYDYSELLTPNEAQSEDANLKTLSNKQPRDDDSLKYTDVIQSKNKIFLSPHVRRLHKQKGPFVNQPSENQPENDIDSTLLRSYYRQPVHHTKSKHVLENQPEDGDNSNPSLPDENQPADNNILRTLNENQSRDDTDTKPLRSNKRYPSRRNKPIPKHSYENQPKNDANSNPTPQDENLPRDDDVAKPLPSNENHSAYEPDSPSFPSHKKQPTYRNKSKQSHVNRQTAAETSPDYLPGVDNDSEPLHSHKKYPTIRNRSKSKTFYGNQPRDNGSLKSPSENEPAESTASKPLRSNESTIISEKQLGDDIEPTPSPHKTQRTHYKKPKALHVNQETDNNNTNPSSQDDDQPGEEKTAKPLPSNENDTFSDKEDGDSSKPAPANKSADDINSKQLRPNKRRQAQQQRNKSKHSPVNKPVNEDNASDVLPSNADESKNESNLTPSSLKKRKAYYNKLKSAHLNQPADDDNSERLSSSVNQSEDDNSSKSSQPSQGNQPAAEDNSKSTSPDDNNLTDDLNLRPTPSVSSKNDDHLESTTLSPTAPYDNTSLESRRSKTNTKRKHRHRKSRTNFPVVSTTSRSDDTPEDEIITLSPIEQVTDNVSDLSTTTAKPDTNKKFNNKPDKAQVDSKSSSGDLDMVQKPTTTALPSSSTSSTDNVNDDETVESQVNNEKNDAQITVGNSSELLDTNTDVPEESDNYSPVTTSPSVQNDEINGNTSDDNSSELEQFETDVTITVSSSTTNDSEGDIFIIHIEVSESTDDDSSSNDKTLVVGIDTNKNNGDGSKSMKTKDGNSDHNNEDGSGNNFEIDLSNLKSEPTTWIRTTNQDFIDKLTAKNDTQFDVIYFFNIESQPVVEREKETTIFCNGTVVIETAETTYASKDDPAPTVVKTTEIKQIEDYES